MRIVYYCQHVLGVGHFFRTLEICRALAGHEITLVTGGPGVEAGLPANVKAFCLPELSMDPEFTSLHAAKGRDVEGVKETRRRMLWDLFEIKRPALFLVELFPFGRKAFSFELLPLLLAIREGAFGSVKVACSLRDILVEKKDMAGFEERAVDWTNRFFDAVLVHADPRVITLSETFSRVDGLKVPLVYTGYVAQKPAPGARQALRAKLGVPDTAALVVASAGGGFVGYDLLDAVLAAFPILRASMEARLNVFTGPYLAEDKFSALAARAGNNARVERFFPDFASLMAAADLSVSMAGYNTCMDLLAARTPALVRPFSQNREQGLRAGRLQKAANLKILADQDLFPEALAKAMQSMLSNGRTQDLDVDLDGAARTARWIEQWMETP